MTTEVRTPLTSAPVELSGGGLYRKQILRFGTIWYTDSHTGKRRKITFDPAYGQRMIESFKDRAFSQVPFQLANDDNRHTNDPTRTGGETVGMELSADGTGVDGILRLWGEGARVIEQNPKLGVSSRIFENAVRPDGRTFPVAVQHVLGTVDPQIVDMRPWEKVDSVDLANSAADTESLLDLSTATYEGSERVAGDGTTLELSTLTAPQQERLVKLLEDDEALEAIVQELGPEFMASILEDEDEEPNEETEDDEEEDVALSNVGSEALELAQAQLDTQGTRILELSAQLNEQRIVAEVATYQAMSLAPAVIEAARPLLGVESGVIELSNGIPGQAVDPGEVIRDVLTTVIDLANSGMLLVDTAETGSLAGNDAAKSTRDALLADWESYH